MSLDEILTIFNGANIHITQIHDGPLGSFIINASINANCESEKMLYELFELLHEHNVVVLCQDFFGPYQELRKCRDTLNPLCANQEWPVNWVKSLHAGGPVSTQLHCIRDLPVERLTLDGNVIGSLYEDEYARYCRISGVVPRDASGTPDEQISEVFDILTQGLRSAGMKFTDVVRTWFYNDGILDWYSSFNQIRRDFYTSSGVLDGITPASTGVCGGNLNGAATTTGLLAIVPKHDAVQIQMVPSPDQGPAQEYGSIFSRAVEVGISDCRYLLISGTASILPDGRTAYSGDVTAQIELTKQVVHGILTSRNMDWNDVIRGIAYLPNIEYIEIFNRSIQDLPIPDGAIICAINELCRGDLLFEIEIDALSR
ncbi:MAG: RidA family protein [Armatimonadota bacterium]